MKKSSKGKYQCKILNEARNKINTNMDSIKSNILPSDGPHTELFLTTDAKRNTIIYMTHAVSEMPWVLRVW